MAICGPAMVPHSHFRGGPPVWTDLDRQKQRLWHRRQAETHSCGIHPDVWDPDRGGNPDGLRLEPTGFCRACELVAEANARHDKKLVDGQYLVWKFGDDPDVLDEQQPPPEDQPPA